MLHVISASPMAPKKFSKYAEDFVLVHLTMTKLPPMNIECYRFQVYHRRDMTTTRIEELMGGSYTSDSTTRFEFLRADTLKVAVDAIAEELKPSGDDEPIIVVAVHEAWSMALVQKLNKRLSSSGSDVTAQDIHRLLHKPNQTMVETYLRMVSGSDNVFQDDPINFGYAVYQLMVGNLR